ncbi:MAG: LPS-assembly protein LptD [Verrucomicrobiae bacterium]|nr:LPS-assembly protein LptD [Verrucomicrobiae bacterium]
MSFRVLCSWLVVFLSLPLAWAGTADSSSDKQVDISADQVEYDQNTRTAHANGHAVIVKDDVRLTCDKAKYNQDSKELFADGNVRFRRGNQEWICESLYYNFETKALTVDKSRSNQGRWFMQSDSTKDAGTNRYEAAKGYLTTCDYPEPHWRITYKRLEIYPGDKIVGHDAVMRIGSVPVFYWPYFHKSLKDDNMPITAVPGVSSRFGPFLYMSYAWGLSDSITVTPHVDLRTQHGIGLGLDLDYKFEEWAIGDIKGYWTSDGDPKDKSDKLFDRIYPRSVGPPVYKEEIDWNRYRVQWEHKTQLSDEVAMMIVANKLSDPDIVQDFFESEFRKDIQPDSFADLTKTGEHYTAGVLARPNLNDFFTTTERLPEAQFSFVRTPLWNSGFYYENENSLADLHRVYSDSIKHKSSLKLLPTPVFIGTNDYNTVRADTFHQLSYPKLLFGWLSLVPRVGGRATYYSRTPTSDQDDTVRGAFDTGAELSFKLSHVYDCNDEELDIHGLRHVITPYVNYSYIYRSHSDPPSSIYQFDTIDAFDPLSQASPPIKKYSRRTQTTRYNPIDFPSFNAIDAIDNEDVFRTGVRNQVQTRRDGQPFDLMDLWVFSDLHIDPRKKEDTDLFSSFELRPTKWSALNLESRYNFDNNELIDFNTELRILQQDKWSFGLGTRYLRKDSSQAVADIHCSLNENWAFSVSERISLSNGKLDEQQYTIFRDLHCWSLSFSFRYQQEEIGADDYQFWLIVSLKALPQLHAQIGQ